MLTTIEKKHVALARYFFGEKQIALAKKSADPLAHLVEHAKRAGVVGAGGPELIFEGCRSYSVKAGMIQAVSVEMKAPPLFEISLEDLARAAIGGAWQETFMEAQ